MEISIEKMGNLVKIDKKFSNKKNIKLITKENSTIADILKELGIPKNFITLILINDKISTVDSKLQNQDKIILYPPMGGG